ncbi:MAG TPA: hypothetical protein PKZ54_09705 [Syntrophorhabdaceae bacterium]|nr:hypothetical protein [Syntrophorhabdaceae bacterium]
MAEKKNRLSSVVSSKKPLNETEMEILIYSGKDGKSRCQVCVYEK